MDMEINFVRSTVVHELFLGTYGHLITGMGFGNSLSLAEGAIDFQEGFLVGCLLHVF